MAVPTIVSSTLSIVSGVGAVTPAIASGAVANDILLWALACKPADTPAVANANGGVWTEIGAAAAAANIKLALFWSRYNGTQGAPTTNVPSDYYASGMIAVRGVPTTGDPINANAATARSTPEASGNTVALVTTLADCLVIDFVAMDGPDIEAPVSAAYFLWSMAGLAGPYVEPIEGSTATGSGAAIGCISGGLAVAGALAANLCQHTGQTWQVAFKRVALSSVSAVPPSAVFSAGVVPVRIAAAAAGVVPIYAAAAGAGVVPVRTTTSTDAGVVPVRISSAAEVGAVPTIETP